MPARIVLVFEEAAFADRAAAELIARGQTAVAIRDPFAALNVLEDSERVELLITGEQFGPGKPDGISLARMAWYRPKPTKVLIVGSPELTRYVAGFGAFLPVPLTEQQVVDKAIELLSTDDWSLSRDSPGVWITPLPRKPT